MIDCTLVTCEEVPTLDPDDRLLVDELHERGRTVSISAWSDPRVDWAASRLCILRSTWDYHRRHREFTAWMWQAASLTTIRNDPRLVSWNAHKSYLRDLECLGVPIVPTAWVRRGEKRALTDLSDAHGWRDLVLKPARGAAAHDVTLVRRDSASFAAGQARLDKLVRTGDVLVQPYLEAVVSYGERALVFFHGRYSHAVVKKPFDRVLVVGDMPSLAVEATSEEIDVASKTLAAVGGRPLYARIDLLRDTDANVCVSEVELIEPGLYLAVHEPARADFADAIERELEADRGEFPVVSCEETVR
jgi:hypothetical protein